MITQVIRRAAESATKSLWSNSELSPALRSPVEPLEPRRLLAGGQNLAVIGTPFDDTCVVEMDANFIYASMNGILLPQPIGSYASVTFQAFDGNDLLVVRNARNGIQVGMIPGNGADVVRVTQDSGDLDSLGGTMFMGVGADSVQDSIFIFDDDDTGADTYTIANPGVLTLSKGGVEKVKWASRNVSAGLFINNDDNIVNIESSVAMTETGQDLTITGNEALGGSGGTDTVNFDGTISNSNILRFEGGPGNDRFNVNGDPFVGGSAIIEFVGNSGTDTLDVNDTADTVSYNFNVGGSIIDLAQPSSQAGQFIYLETESVLIETSHATAATTFEINGVSGTTDLSISAGEGNDAFIVGDDFMTTTDFGTSVDMTLIGGNGDDTLLVRDALQTAARTHLWDALGIYDTDVLGTIDVSSIATATLNCGSGADVIDINFAITPGTLIVNGNGGADSFFVTPDITSEIRVNGGSPTTAPGDTLTLESAPVGGTFTNGGVGAGTYDFPQRDLVVFTGMENFPQPAASPGAADLSTADDTGVSNTDNITNDTSLNFSGTGALASSTVKLFRDGTEVASTTATAGGAYNFANVAFPAGDNTFAMTVAYVAGAANLLSVASPALNVRVDTIAPATPAATDLAATSDSGFSSTDNLTNDNTPTFTGTLVANDIARLFDGGALIASDMTTAGGSYSITTAALGDGAHLMTVRIDDIAGNQSAVGPGLGVTIDTVAPSAAPSTPDLTTDTGISGTDNITNDDTPTFAITAAERVRLLDGATIVADFALPPSVTASTLADGSHTITARSVDLAGNLSAATSAGLTVTIDTVAPSSPVVAPDLTTDTGISGTDNITNDNTPAFAGPVVANDIVRLFANGNLVASDTSTPGGTYSITLTAQADGVYNMRAAFEDVAGNQSGAGPAVSVTIDTVAPSAPTVAPDLAASSDSGLSNTDNVTNDNTPTFTGTAVPSTIVRLRAGGFSVGFDQLVGLDLAYSVTSAALADGTHAMTVVHEDVAGNQSAAGPALGVRIDTVAPTVTASQFNFETGHALAIAFSENVSATLSTADLSLQNLTTGAFVAAGQMQLAFAANTGTFTFPGAPGAFLADGDYQATVLAAGVSDVAGNLLAGNTRSAFFVLSGDANRDRRVDIGDFSIVATNFNAPGTFSQGDLNYNGQIEIGDFSILASRFNSSLQPAGLSYRSIPWRFSSSAAALAMSDARFRTSDGLAVLLDPAQSNRSSLTE